jgi:phosphatidylserine decarboxylase
MKVAREGHPFIVTGAVLSAVAFLLGSRLLGAIFGLLTLAFFGFFRDPERAAPQGDGLIVAPADGKVVSVVDVAGEPGFSGAEKQISVFLSPFDVHINRSPIDGRVTEVSYRKGSYRAAFREDASKQNERNTLRIVDGQQRSVAVSQIAGVLARRIVCRVREGDWLARGERFGLIMFGSRTDIYLPADCRVEVTEGQRVKGGETIIGRFS